MHFAIWSTRIFHYVMFPRFKPYRFPGIIDGQSNGVKSMCISQSVGLDAPNKNDDVTVIQALLNLNLSLLPGMPFLLEDGVLGPHSQSVIHQFQSLLAKPGDASGVIDPGSATLIA